MLFHVRSIQYGNGRVKRKVSISDADDDASAGLPPAMDRIGRPTPIRWYLKEWRDHLGLTQDQVAARIETNRGQVQKLESGKQRMNDRWISSFAHAFNIEPGRLLSHPDCPSSDDLLRGLPQDVKERADAVLKAVVGR